MYATLLILTGCSTYGKNLNKSIELAKAGDYIAAETELTSKLTPTGNDALLYHLELGSLKHLAGEFEQSNQLLETANEIAEELYTRKVSDMLKVLMSNPRNGPYRGSDMEKVFINYTKAVNYLKYGLAHEDEREKSIENARIEARRLLLKLESLERTKLSYEEKEKKDEQSFTKLLKFFQIFAGNYIDKDALLYRNDAYIHYLTGVMFELGGERSNARISYEKSAKLYEAGFAKQYSLDTQMVEQAWFDTIRTMKLNGGWEDKWPTLAKEKLSEEKQTLIETYTADTAELLIIQHVGLVPQKGEMNFYLFEDSNTNDLVLQPIFTGANAAQQEEQHAWFYMMYADKSLFGLIDRYNKGGVWNAWWGSFSTRRVGFLDIGNAMSALHLDQALDNGGMRVIVPYSPSLRYRPEPGNLNINGQTYDMMLAQSPAAITQQEMMYNAQNELLEALARESIKNIAALATAKAIKDPDAQQSDKQQLLADLLTLSAKAVANFSARADTRGWLLLPHDIRIQRIKLEPGTYTLSLNTAVGPNNTTTAQIKEFNITPGTLHTWFETTMDKRPTPPNLY